jgi:hypothetical protein
MGGKRLADRAFERPSDVAARGYQRREPVPLGRPSVRFFGTRYGPLQMILPPKTESRNDGVDGAPNGICVPRWSLSSTHLKGAVHGEV